MHLNLHLARKSRKARVRLSLLKPSQAHKGLPRGTYDVNVDGRGIA